MKVKFWGTRGSLPRATSHEELLGYLKGLFAAARQEGIQTTRTLELALEKGQFGWPLAYGGNTTCTEVIHKEQNFFIDMGTGIREAGTFYTNKGTKEFHIFLTHMHWDHVMGLPFFVPIHAKGFHTKIYHVHRNAPEYVKINFNGVNFPLTWNQLGGTVEFEQLRLYEPKQIGATRVTPFVLDHPGGSFGFRFDAEGQSVAIGVDGEYKRVTAEDLGKDLPYYQNLDLLVFDAQYEISELASRFDWGHCSPHVGIELALREGIRHVAFTHHDPWSTADKLRRMYQAAGDHLKRELPKFQQTWDARKQPAGPRSTTAYDGLVIDLDNP